MSASVLGLGRGLARVAPLRRAGARSLMQLVQSTPAAAAASQLQQFPEMIEAERSIRTGKAPAAAILLERVAEVTGMALGQGSDLHVAALRR